MLLKDVGMTCSPRSLKYHFIAGEIRQLIRRPNNKQKKKKYSVDWTPRKEDLGAKPRFCIIA